MPPLSGEAIRLMNYVDDVATTLRRILALSTSLTPEEKARVGDHLAKSEPNAQTVAETLRGGK